MKKILLVGINDILIHNLYDRLVEIYKKENIYLILLDKIGYYKVKYENKIIINNYYEIENIIKLINPEKIIFSIPNYDKLYSDKYILDILQLSIIIKKYNGKIIIINNLNNKLKEAFILFNIEYTFINNVYGEYDYYSKINHYKIIQNKNNFKHICQYFNLLSIKFIINEEDCYKKYLEWYNKTDQSLLYEL
jgi:hypothetical protein